MPKVRCQKQAAAKLCVKALRRFATNVDSFLSLATKLTPTIAGPRDRDVSEGSARMMDDDQQGSSTQGPTRDRRFELSSGAVPA